MLLTEWTRNKGKGALRELELATKLNNRTVAKAARDGLAVSYEVAEKLSEATRPIDPKTGKPDPDLPPACSIEEIRHPDRFAKRRRAAS